MSNWRHQRRWRHWERKRTPLWRPPRARPEIADGAIESGKQSARTIAILIIVAAVVIAALVVWFIVGALR